MRKTTLPTIACGAFFVAGTAYATVSATPEKPSSGLNLACLASGHERIRKDVMQVAQNYGKRAAEEVVARQMHDLPDLLRLIGRPDISAEVTQKIQIVNRRCGVTTH